MRFLALGLAALGLAGCVPIAVPLQSGPPRYSASQLDALEGGSVDRAQVLAKLGAPDLARGHDRFWIYQWTVNSGRWLGVSLVGVGGADLGPVHVQRFVRVFEFDADGRLLGQSRAAPAGPVPEDRSCTPGDVCIDHRVAVRQDREGIPEMGFRDGDSALTLPPGAAPGPVPTDRCHLVAWLADGVALPWRRRQPPVRGVSLAVGPAVAGSPATADWLPDGSWTQVELAPGPVQVEVVSQGGILRIDCPAGEARAIEVARDRTAPEGPLRLSLVEAGPAGVALAARRRVVAR